MPVIYMERESFNTISESDIKRLITDVRDMTRYRTLRKYYLGEHEILNSTKKDSTAPNNKIVANMCQYVTLIFTGFFIGEPVRYTSDDDEYLQAISDVFRFNDEEDENAELATWESIHGEVYEILYIDELGNIRFTYVPADTCILIKDSASEDGYLGFIRFLESQDKNKNKILKVEFTTAKETWHFYSHGGSALTLVEIVEHFWNDVPIVEYLNNANRKGDFEGIISINDGYNRVQSNTANVFQYNDEAILKVTKMGEVTSQDIRDMKEKGAIILDDGGDISWLIKNTDDSPLENYKNRLVKDMHKYSCAPDMNDEAFSGNTTGVAISYKIWGMDQICKIKERKFYRGLQRRIELITNILNLYGHSWDFRDIDIKFKRNRPQNLLEDVQLASMLSSQVSHETALSYIPGIDPSKELDKIKEENTDEENSMGVYKNLAKVFKDVEENEQE